MPRPGVVPCVVLATVLSCLPVASGENPKAVLAKVREYLAWYDRQLVTLVADEHYGQEVPPTAGATRSTTTLHAELGWVRVGQIGETIGVREVLAVGGRPVTGRRRLRALLEQPPAAPLVEIRAILAESARWNLGSAQRNINFLTFALAYLRAGPSDGTRWHVDVAPNGRVLRFEERGRGTVIRSPDGERAPAVGRFWMDAQATRILRTEVSVRVTTDGVARNYRLDVEFGEDARFGLWLPVRMRERFTAAGGLVELTGEATYSNYRRYETSGRVVP